MEKAFAGENVLAGKAYMSEVPVTLLVTHWDVRFAHR
jgi:hypothetical protein